MATKATASVTIADISDGTDGTGINTVEVKYQAGSSGTTAPTGTWSTSVPAATADKPYMWTRVTYTYTDGSAPKVVYSVGCTPEGIEVGGRNLLRYTKDFDFKSGVSYGSSQKTGERYNDLAVRYLSTVGATSYKAFVEWGDAIDVDKTNQQYTMSFFAKGVGSVRCHFYPNAVTNSINSQSVFNTYPDGQSDFTLSNEWTRYWVIYNATSSSDNLGKKRVLIRLIPGNECYICGVKFEKGNKATDWTPAPEDVAQDISDVDTKADNAQTSANEANETLLNWCYNNDKTYINGSKIYAGSVTANQIAANAVTAEKLSVATLSAISADLGAVTAGSINIGNGKFTVTSAGVLTAKSGTIGSITVYENQLTTVKTENGYDYITAIRNATSNTKVIEVTKRTTPNGTDYEPQFYVRYDGYVWAKNANISGVINATSIKAKESYSLYVPDMGEEIVVSANSWSIAGTEKTYTVVYGIPGKTGAVFVNGVTSGHHEITLDANEISMDGAVDIWQGGLLVRAGGIESWEAITCNDLISASGYKSESKSTAWVNALKGNAALSIDESGSAGGFNCLSRVKCANGAWAIGALNSNNDFCIVYGNETRLTNSTAGYDKDFRFTTGGNFQASGYLLVPNGQGLKTKNTSGMEAWAISWRSDNNLYVGETTTKPGKIRISQTAANIEVLNSAGSWVSLTSAVSDEREKNSIEDLKKSKEIIMGLRPKRYKYNDPDDDRYHLGFVAQDVRKTLDATIGDCAILEYNNLDPDEIRPVDMDDESTFTYTMRYTELIAPHVALTQDHERRLAKAEAEIERLRKLLNEMK